MKTYLIEISKRIEVEAENRTTAIQRATERFHSDEIKDEFKFGVLTEWESPEKPIKP